MSPHDHEENKPARSHLKTIAVVGFFVVAGALFFSEHRAHALGYLPYLLLIACPLLHLMHGGHGGHGGSAQQRNHAGHEENKR